MKFEDVIGLEEAKHTLTQLLEQNRLPHAILLTGPEGVGKFALALAFACKILNPTDNDRIAKMLDQFDHPDLHFTFPTIKLPSMSATHQPVSDDFAREWQGFVSKTGYFSFEQWMETIGVSNQQAIITAKESDELTRKLSLKSSQGGYKVAIIWLPERMNDECSNKILKLLEEPPSQTIFLMVSEHPEQLLETIRSRVQQIVVKQLVEEEISEALIQQRGIEPSIAKRYAHIARGSWLRAIGLLNASNEERTFLDMFIILMRYAYMREVKGLKKWSENVAAFGREKQKRMLTYFLRMVRENFMYNFQNPELVYMTEEEENFAKNFARFINEANVIEINKLLQECIRDISQNANGKIVFYDMSLKMIVLLIKK